MKLFDVFTYLEFIKTDNLIGAAHYALTRPLQNFPEDLFILENYFLVVEKHKRDQTDDEFVLIMLKNGVTVDLEKDIVIAEVSFNNYIIPLQVDVTQLQNYYLQVDLTRLSLENYYKAMQYI